MSSFEFEEEEKLLQMVHDFIESEPTTIPSHSSSSTLNHAQSRHSSRYFTLQEIMRKKTGEERRIQGEVGKHMRNKLEMEKSRGLKQWLVNSLIMDGFHASLCHSSWLTTHSCSCGSYEYIEITEEDQRGVLQTIIVDIDFKSQFEVARPTQGYKELLNKIPTIFVGGEAKLNSIINLVCSAAEESLKDQGLHIPPWRRIAYMQSKWKLSTGTKCSKVNNVRNIELLAAPAAGTRPLYTKDHNYYNSDDNSEKWVPSGVMVKGRRRELSGRVSGLSNQISKMSINCC